MIWKYKIFPVPLQTENIHDNENEVTMKITMLKNYRQKDSLRLIELSDVAALMRGEEYRRPVENLRSEYNTLHLEREADGNLTGSERLTALLPRLCFARQKENRQGKVVVKGYTSLVLLEVNNLTGFDEATAIRRGAAEMPHTLMAFVGASGRSVKIIVRGERLGTPGERMGTTDETLEASGEKTEWFHENLYERARLAYNTQLGVTIEKHEPRLDRVCYMSYDPDAYFNPMAMPLYAQAERPAGPLAVGRKSTLEDQKVSPGVDRYMTLYHAYEFNMERTFDELEGLAEGDERNALLLTTLAAKCLETGIPMGVAVRLTEGRARAIGVDKLLVEKVFANIYRPELVRRYQQKQHISLGKHIPQETLLTMKIDLFLQENYEIRKNVMRGVAEFRERTGIGFAFRDLTEEARNSITMRALRQGIKCWDKDIRRYVNSEDVEQYGPLNEWLEALPVWDGEDRVTPLAMRVPTGQNQDVWVSFFQLWMRSMVAMWLGKGQLTGNALVPLLIGRQGCGKSSFCRILLPRELQYYYNDRINFKNEADLNLGLTSFGLINLDEFDSVTRRQQVVLKYLVSTADLKYRPPYGKAYRQHRRYASFIGTTNDPTPLTDPSGSRRFICMPVVGDIDFRTPVDHDQLYAQLLSEVNSGQRYWPTRDEEQQLMNHNERFRQVSGLDEMLFGIIGKPSGRDDGQWMTLKDISALLKSHYSGYQEDPGAFRKIGAILRREELQFDSHRYAAGMSYFVKLK